MNLDFIQRITKWNEDRGNQRGHIEYMLEHKMIEEEVDEFFDAEKDVDRLDALCDVVFVAVGSMHKLGLTPQQIDKAMNTVCDANDKKLANKKSNGKISKPKDFIGPEPKLQKILDEINKG